MGIGFLPYPSQPIFHIDLYRGTQRPLVSDQDLFSRNPNLLFLLLPALTSLYL